MYQILSDEIACLNLVADEPRHNDHLNELMSMVSVVGIGSRK